MHFLKETKKTPLLISLRLTGWKFSVKIINDGKSKVFHGSFADLCTVKVEIDYIIKHANFLKLSQTIIFAKPSAKIYSVRIFFYLIKTFIFDKRRALEHFAVFIVMLKYPPNDIQVKNQ